MALVNDSSVSPKIIVSEPSKVVSELTYTPSLASRALLPLAVTVALVNASSDAPISPSSPKALTVERSAKVPVYWSLPSKSCQTLVGVAV